LHRISILNTNEVSMSDPATTTVTDSDTAMSDAAAAPAAAPAPAAAAAIAVVPAVAVAAAAAAAVAAAVAVAAADAHAPAATAAAATAAATATAPVSLKRDSLNGVWVLDKTRGEWSMRGYLETLHVTELAIQAHEKGELEFDTLNTIELSEDNEHLKIIKRSRVNNDLVIELRVGEELVQYLQPGERAKKSLATTEDPGKHLQIKSSLMTMNGMAYITDIKRLVQEENRSSLCQELTIVNEETKQSKTTTRYFNPFNGSMERDDIIMGGT
jgi:hypothetical protein